MLRNGEINGFDIDWDFLSFGANLRFFMIPEYLISLKHLNTKREHHDDAVLESMINSFFCCVRYRLIRHGCTCKV